VRRGERLQEVNEGKTQDYECDLFEDGESKMEEDVTACGQILYLTFSVAVKRVVVVVVVVVVDCLTGPPVKPLAVNAARYKPVPYKQRL